MRGDAGPSLKLRSVSMQWHFLIKKVYQCSEAAFIINQDYCSYWKLQFYKRSVQAVFLAKQEGC